MPDYQLFGGFLILEPDADIPDDVEVVAPDLPIFCGVGDDAEAPTAEIEKPTSIEYVKTQLGVPLYTLLELPKEYDPWQCELIKDKTDNSVYAFTLLFNGSQTQQVPTEPNSIRLTAEKQFAKPYPIRKPSLLAEWGANSTIEIVETLLPTPGVKITDDSGQSFYWIQDETLYTLYVEFGINIREADVQPDFVPNLEQL